MRLQVPTLLTLVVASQAIAQTYSMKTFAGGALPENVAATSASVGGIYGIAADRAGNVFLSLGDYDLVLRVDAATGTLIRVAGNGSRGFSGDNGAAPSAQLSGPGGLAIDAAGNLYVADANNLRVRMVANGAIGTIAGSGAQGYDGDGAAALQASFNGLAGIAIDHGGNLYVAVHVTPHPLLRRDGTEIYYDLSLSIAQAALGTRARIPTIEGDEDLEVRAGTQPGTEIRMRNRGVPHLRRPVQLCRAAPMSHLWVHERAVGPGPDRVAGPLRLSAATPAVASIWSSWNRACDFIQSNNDHAVAEAIAAAGTPQSLHETQCGSILRLRPGCVLPRGCVG